MASSRCALVIEFHMSTDSQEQRKTSNALLFELLVSQIKESSEE